MSREQINIQRKKNKKMESQTTGSKKKFKFQLRRGRSLLFSLGVIFVAGFFVFGIGKSVYEIVTLQSDNNQLGEQIDNLYFEKQQLLKKKENLDSEAMIEAEAKESLGLIKADEKVLVLE